jgi:hypothetical protein
MRKKNLGSWKFFFSRLGKKIVPDWKKKFPNVEKINFSPSVLRADLKNDLKKKEFERTI